MEYGMSRRITPKEKYARSLKEIWSNLDGPPNNNIPIYCTRLFYARIYTT